MNNYFINEAFDYAIKSYLESKNHKDGIVYNSFLVVVVRSLINIYGELDIIGAYENNDELLLHSNMLKFRLSKMKLNKFFLDVQSFYNNEKLEIVPNSIFISIEMFLIDMYMAKKINYNVTSIENDEFKKLLYSPYAKNPLMISFNYQHSTDNFVVTNYFDSQDRLNIKVEVSEPKVLLAPEAYRIINKNYTDVCLLSADDVKKINDEVYSSLNVDKNMVNFEYLYDLALYNFYNKDRKLTSGNGYVDILLVMGIISTFVMTLAIVGFIILS